MRQRIQHRPDGGAAPIDAERHRRIFMPGDTFDQRVLHPGIPKVVNEGMAEAVEGLAAIGDTLFGLVTTEPL
jgi:hypothetical protein